MINSKFGPPRAVNVNDRPDYSKFGPPRAVNVNDRPDYLMLPSVNNDAAPASGPQQPVVPQTGFAYQHEDAYQRLLQQAANPRAYQYSPGMDAAARNYARIYRREGDRATANALAQAAAATGGVPSSYAVGAAQQAGAYYASQMADKAAELEQQAYQRYLNERAQSLQGLNALSSDREDAYNKYLRQQAAEQEAARLAAAQYLDGTNGVSQAIIGQVWNATNGSMQITSPYEWQVLLEDYTEDQLRAAGITYVGG